MGAAAIFLPLIPGFIKTLMDMVSAIRTDPGTPDEVKAKLDAISVELQAVVAKVQAVQLPNKA